MNIANLTLYLTQRLQNHTDSPRLDAELLIGSVLQMERAQLYIHHQKPLTETELAAINQLTHRRILGEPIAYILGYKSFWNLKFKVNHATLIPRPETELLVDWLLQQLPKNEAITIADLGTGSGAIALSLAIERPQWEITATDASAAALAIAEINAIENNINNLEFRLGSWCQALNRQYDVIVSNPPYIAVGDPHLAHLQYEPSSALVAEQNGLADLKCIIAEAPHYLNPNGILALEHGYDQSVAVQNLLQLNYGCIQSHRDYNQQWRFTTATLSNRA